MVVRVVGSLLWNKNVVVNINVDLSKPMTIFIGPNLSGKTLTMICIAKHSKHAIMGISTALGGVACESDEEIDHAVFVDSHRNGALEELRKHAVNLPRAVDTVNTIEDEFRKIVEDVAIRIGEGAERFKNAFRHSIPSIDFENLRGEPTAPSLVILHAALAHALPGTKVLLIDEPELHSHPTTAFFLGFLLTKLAMSDNTMRVVAATHSFEFLQGALTSENNVNVFVFDRRIEGETTTLTAEPWNHAAAIPGFTEPGVLSIMAR
jgi:predicted ATPase